MAAGSAEKRLCSWGSQVSDNVEHGAHSLADWSDTMSAPYLPADTHWTLIEVHRPAHAQNFKQLLGPGASESLLYA